MKRFRSHIIVIIFILILAMPLLFCTKSQGVADGFIVKRPKPTREYAVGTANSVLVSSSEVEFLTEGQRVVFRYYRFKKADNEKVYIEYQEFYNRVDETPDLVESRTFDVKNPQADLGDFILEIYELKTDAIVYTIREKQ